MALKLASTTEGHCAACSIPIEQGDWFDPATRTHVGCRDVRPSSKPSEFQLTSSGLLFPDAKLSEVESLRAAVGAVDITPRGKTYSETHDKTRLIKHLFAVFETMKDGRFRSISVIAEQSGCGECSAAARARQLRALGHDLQKRWVKGESGERGYYEYRLVVNGDLIAHERDEPRAA